MAEKELRVSEFAKIDLERESRTGIPEVILAEGKKFEHLVEIVTGVLQKKGMTIITRLDPSSAENLHSRVGTRASFDYHGDAKVAVVKRTDFKSTPVSGKVGIVAAGTSDYPVGEEARVIVESLGCTTLTEYDVGVAGVHRLFTALEKMINAGVDVYIVIAGREGALPTLVAGIVDAPVIGVPVSSGYGYGGKGEAALKAMLQSCSPLTVVNIDAGFVAAVAAVQIVKRINGMSRNRER
jgi:NCAIR mutase (PurE)-related protein